MLACHGLRAGRGNKVAVGRENEWIFKRRIYLAGRYVVRACLVAVLTAACGQGSIESADRAPVVVLPESPTTTLDVEEIDERSEPAPPTTSAPNRAEDGTTTSTGIAPTTSADSFEGLTDPCAEITERNRLECHAAINPTADSVVVTPTSEVNPLFATGVYCVTDVASDDVLNLRSGPGVSNNVVWEIPYQSCDLLVLDPVETAPVGSSTWIRVTFLDQNNEQNGWVNSQFIQFFTAERDWR